MSGPADGRHCRSVRIIGRQLGKRALFYREGKQRHDPCAGALEIKKGEKVLITEEVTTGKSSMETAKVIEELGGEVSGIARIVDRRVNDIFARFTCHAAETPPPMKECPWGEPGQAWKP